MIYNAPEGKFQNSEECIKSLEEQRYKQEGLGEKIYDGEFSQTVGYALLLDTINRTEAEGYLAEALQKCIADCHALQERVEILNKGLELWEDDAKLKTNFVIPTIKTCKSSF